MKIHLFCPVLVMGLCLLSQYALAQRPSKISQTPAASMLAVRKSVQKRFTRPQRMAIWKELEAAVTKAQAEADKRHPDNLEKNNQYQEDRTLKYWALIKKRWKIADNEIDAINSEAVKNEWWGAHPKDNPH